jgi:hypothetical protein
MNYTHPERWSVDGYDVLWEPNATAAKVTVTKNDLTVSAGVEGPPEAWPPQETIEHLAIQLWEAANSVAQEPRDRRKRSV